MKQLILSLAALLSLAAAAKVRLPHILGDGMVVQQDTEVRLWGWAKPGAKVAITTSWAAGKTSCTADNQGRWLAIVRTPKASYTPLSITFSDGDGTTKLADILAGEVWVCAGQSNMEMPVKGFGQCPVENYNEVALDAAAHPGIRSVKIPARMSATPQDDADCAWRRCTTASVGEFSATGYFFARQLENALHIPIGLIEANKGGSRLESWLTKDNLQRYTSDPTDSAAIAAKWSQYDYHRSLLWGNATFNPILHYTIKGIIYYQGCSNVGDPGDQYSTRMKLLVEQWRGQFALGQIPFYFVQIAPYRYSPDGRGIYGALLREQQQKAADIIPNSSVVCINDLVYPHEGSQIHPTQKRQVGERLAWTALARDYGFQGVNYRSSRFKDYKVDGSRILLHFADNYGCDSPFEGAQGFEIAGADRVFHPATATHFWQPGGGEWDEALAVSSPDVPAPVAVRYCFHDFQTGTVKNGAGLPLFPFRTDKW